MNAQQRLRRFARRAKAVAAAVGGWLGISLLRLSRRMDPDRSSALAGRLMQRLGPWLPEHRVGRANLAAAFPEKSADEIEHILRGAWDNLGRVGAEYAHLDRLWDYDAARPTPGRIEIPAQTLERFMQVRDDGKPALIFAAHLANWELPALAGTAHGVPSAVIYRIPNVGNVAAAVRAMRSGVMGELIPTGIGAPSAVAAALERGVHVGILVDQYLQQGVDVVFFGRRTKANPMIARIARHFECPIHGVRAVRLPGHRFRVEVTEAIVAPRDAEGRIDVPATMQVITDVVEGWVREHPEQWLWLHRRWR
jgi:Kdo2-lipid IVA lauroyltransferase/acyltransferase